MAQLLVEHFADRPGEFEVLHPERYFPTEYRRRSKVTVPVVHTEPLEGFRVLEALSGNPTAELRAAILNLDIPGRTGGRETPLRRAFAGDARREGRPPTWERCCSSGWPTAPVDAPDLPKQNPATSS